MGSPHLDRQSLYWNGGLVVDKTTKPLIQATMTKINDNILCDHWSLPLLLTILLLLGHKELNHSLFRTAVAISGWSAYVFMKQCCLLISLIQSGGHTMVSNYTEGCQQNIAIYMSANICCRNTEHNISHLGNTVMKWKCQLTKFSIFTETEMSFENFLSLATSAMIILTTSKQLWRKKVSKWEKVHFVIYH